MRRGLRRLLDARRGANRGIASIQQQWLETADVRLCRHPSLGAGVQRPLPGAVRPVSRVRQRVMTKAVEQCEPPDLMTTGACDRKPRRVGSFASVVRIVLGDRPARPGAPCVGDLACMGFVAGTSRP